MSASAAPDAIVHDHTDTVAVIVVEDVKPGDSLSVWVMDQDRTYTVEAKDSIPLGHKIALDDIEDAATVIKYGQDIGRAVQPIPQGHHVHVHNLKTKRW